MSSWNTALLNRDFLILILYLQSFQLKRNACVNFDLFYRPVKTRFRKHCETTGIDRHHVLWLDTILITGGCLCNVSAQNTHVYLAVYMGTFQYYLLFYR